MRIGVTGSKGLIGLHLMAHLRARTDHDLVGADRETFATAATLDDFVRGCDVIVHLAGMNRGEDDVIERVNVELAQQLVDACRRLDQAPQIIFSNSTHRDRESPYGRSKRRAAEILDGWADVSGGRFADLVLPHVFGEYGRPFYNSVVSTFCHQLARNEVPSVEVDAELELLHAQRVAEVVSDLIASEGGGVHRASGQPITVTALLARLRLMGEDYEDGRIPDLRDDFDRDLFNALRSYWFPERFPRTLHPHADERGELVEAVKTLNGGQVFFSETRPGFTRGNHYHLRKVERFLVVRGEAVISLRRVFDDHVFDFPVSGEVPAFVDIPTLHTHSISNNGTSELLTLFWAHEIFDPEASDTYAEPVRTEAACA